MSLMDKLSARLACAGLPGCSGTLRAAFVALLIMLAALAMVTAGTTMASAAKTTTQAL